MVTLLDAQAVQAQLKLRSRAKAIEIMARLPHIDLAPPGSRKRNLRVTEATLDAYCQGQITPEGYNVPIAPRRKASRQTNPNGRRQPINPATGEFVAYRR